LGSDGLWSYLGRSHLHPERVKVSSRSEKYEDVYLKGYSNMAELTVGLAEYFAFYNTE
jgi:hypothetical protein